MSNPKPIKIPNYIKNRIVQQNHYIDKAQAIATEIENWAASIGCNTCDTQFYSNTRLGCCGVEPFTEDGLQTYIDEHINKNNEKEV